MIVSRMTSQGRVTLPPQVCEALGLEAGDRLAYEIDGDQVILSKGEAPHAAIDTMAEAELQAIIDAALADQRPTVSTDEAFAAVRARIEARARRMNAA